MRMEMMQTSWVMHPCCLRVANRGPTSSQMPVCIVSFLTIQMNQAAELETAPTSK